MESPGPASESESELFDIEEPIFKYERLGGSVPVILSSDEATSLACTDRLVVLGTKKGRVHVLDVNGDEVRILKAHMERVNAVDINRENSHVASCSEDGIAVVFDLWEDQKEVFKFGSNENSAVKVISLHSKYPEKDGKVFASVTKAQNLVINSMSYIGHKKFKVPGGELSVSQCLWAPNSNLLAFATRSGVKVFDYEAQIPVTMVPKPKRVADSTLHPCCLSWKSNTRLMIGWSDVVQIIDISPNTSYFNDPTNKISAMSRTSDLDSNQSSMSSSKISKSAGGLYLLRSSAKFRLEGYVIAGIAPYNEYMAILAIPKSNSSSESSDIKEDETSISSHPEFLIVSDDGEIISCDALPIVGYENLDVNSYKLAAYTGDELTSDSDFHYFIVTPKDIVVAKVRTIDDHIEFLLEKGDFKGAYEEATHHQIELRRFQVLEIAEKYLRHLLKERNFTEAASLCPRLFGDNVKLWETWILVFAKEKQCKALAPYVPTGNPRLSDLSYGIILKDFLLTDHDEFLNLIRDWPRDLYDHEVVVAAIKERLAFVRSPPLMEALTEIFLKENKFTEAVSVLIALKKDDVFHIIQSHNLFDNVRDKIVDLCKVNAVE